MMKLQLSPEAFEAIKRISPKVHAANRYSAKSTSALVNAIIVASEPLLTPTLVSAIAAKLVSPAGRRRALLEAMTRVAQTADEHQLKKLENQLQRLQGEPAKALDPQVPRNSHEN